MPAPPPAAAQPASESDLAALAATAAQSLATTTDLAKASLAGVTIVLTVQRMGGDVRGAASHAALARAAVSAVAGLRRAGPPTGPAEAEACLGSNAAAALSALVQAGDESVVTAALEAGAAGVATALLAAEVGKGADASPPPSSSAALNYTALLGGLARSGGDAGALALVDAGAAAALVSAAGASALGATPHAPLFEATADALCALAACPAAREAAEDAGVPGALASILVSAAAASPSPDAEAGVRALLALGMLCPGRPGCQAAVLSTPGAVGALVSTMRAREDGEAGDEDGRLLARDLFAVLAAEGGEGRRAEMVGALQQRA